MLIQWKKEFSCGHAGIDADHRMVIDLLNEMNVALMVLAPPEVITTALRTLDRRVDDHFCREEAHFNVLSAEDAQHHTTDHQEMRNRIRTMIGDWESGTGALVNQGELQFLADYWVTHITKSDVKLTAALSEHPN